MPWLLLSAPTGVCRAREHRVEQKGMGNVQIVQGRKEFKIIDPTQLSLVQELAPIQRNLVVHTGTVGEASAGQVPAHGRLQLTKVQMCGKGEARIRMPPRVSPAQRDLPRKPFVLMEAPRWTEITTALVSGDHRTSQADVATSPTCCWLGKRPQRQGWWITELWVKGP